MAQVTNLDLITESLILLDGHLSLRIPLNVPARPFFGEIPSISLNFIDLVEISGF